MKGGRALADGATGWFPLGAVVHSTPSAARPTLGLWFREPLRMVGGRDGYHSLSPDSSGRLPPRAGPGERWFVCR